jgi:hypothetical protein
LREVQFDRHLIQAGKRQCHFADVGVARTLADAVDRTLNPVGAAAHGGNRQCCAQPEVVVPVKVQRYLVADPRPDLSHQVFDRLGRTGTDRIDDRHFGGSRVEGRLIGGAEELQVAARTVHRKEQHPHTVVDSVAHGFADALQHNLAGEAIRGDFDVTGGNLDQGLLDSELDQGVQIRFDGARKAPDLGLQPSLDNTLHCA